MRGLKRLTLFGIYVIFFCNANAQQNDLFNQLSGLVNSKEGKEVMNSLQGFTNSSMSGNDKEEDWISGIINEFTKGKNGNNSGENQKSSSEWLSTIAEILKGDESKATMALLKSLINNGDGDSDKSNIFAQLAKQMLTGSEDDSNGLDINQIVNFATSKQAAKLITLLKEELTSFLKGNDYFKKLFKNALDKIKKSKEYVKFKEDIDVLEKEYLELEKDLSLKKVEEFALKMYNKLQGKMMTTENMKYTSDILKFAQKISKLATSWQGSNKSNSNSNSFLGGNNKTQTKTVNDPLEKLCNKATCKGCCINNQCHPTEDCNMNTGSNTIFIVLFTCVICLIIFSIVGMIVFRLMRRKELDEIGLRKFKTSTPDTTVYSNVQLGSIESSTRE